MCSLCLFYSVHVFTLFILQCTCVHFVYFRDSWGRIQCQVVAIDALVFRDYKSQFTPFNVKRELDKVGFLSYF